MTMISAGAEVLVAGSSSIFDGIESVSTNIKKLRSLVATIDHNLTAPRGKARFQRKVAYDNLSEESVAAFRPLASGRGQALLEGLDAWLSHHDRDVNPQAGGTGRMLAGLGVYYFEEDLSEEGSSEESASREDSP